MIIRIIQVAKLYSRSTINIILFRYFKTKYFEKSILRNHGIFIEDPLKVVYQYLGLFVIHMVYCICIKKCRDMILLHTWAQFTSDTFCHCFTLKCRKVNNSIFSCHCLNCHTMQTYARKIFTVQIFITKALKECLPQLCLEKVVKYSEHRNTNHII